MVPRSRADRRSGPLALGRLLVAIAGVVAVLVSGEARADGSKRACIDANEHAQVDERAGRLRKAHEQLVFCASDTCPPVLRADCARLLTEATERQPTVVVKARDASGAETTEVSMYVDGVLVAESLGGLEIEVDPGPHTLRFAAKGSGQVKEQQLVLQEGDKRRKLSVEFAKPVSATPAPVAPIAPARTEAPPPAAHASILPLVLGGAAAVSAGTFGVFAGLGYSKEKSLASSCAPHCTSDAVAPVRTDYLVGDIALGVAVVSLGAAVLVAWLGHGQPQATAAWRLDVGPLRGGAGVSGEIGW
jgi:hypothetical protein